MTENKINFEESLSELEKIIASLEGGDCTLDEAIKLFENGIKYTDRCRSILDSAEKKIITLTELEREENTGD